MENTTTMPSGQLQVNQNGIEFLKETSKWALFLAIIGYLGIGLMVLVALFVFGIGAMAETGELGLLGGGAVALIYLLMALLYFFPVHYLFKFSEQMKRAVSSGEDNQLETGLKYLKKHYKFLGIMTIALIALYMGLFFVGVVMGIAGDSF